MDLDAAVVGEYAVDAALGVGDAPAGPRIGVGLAQHRDLVAELVADQRERVVDDVGDEQLRAARARRHRPVVRVDRLVDRDVLVEMQPHRAGVRPRDHADLGGRRAASRSRLASAAGSRIGWQ